MNLENFFDFLRKNIKKFCPGIPGNPGKKNFSRPVPSRTKKKFPVPSRPGGKKKFPSRPVPGKVCPGNSLDPTIDKKYLDLLREATEVR